MITCKQRKKAQENFRRAANMLGFELEMPYCIDREKGLSAFGYMPQYGSKNGVIFDVVDSVEDTRSRDTLKYCEAHQIFYSQLCIESLVGEYDQSYFDELLEDWHIAESQ